jgi:hypothetical protein
MNIYDPVPIEIIKVSIHIGADITGTCEEALAMANVTKKIVIFEFNYGVSVIVRPNDKVKDLIKIYSRMIG